MVKEKDKEGKWIAWVLTLLVACLLAFGAIIVVVDPFFHYHAPLKGISYSLERDNERYQNWGILSHFSYDTVFIGTSLTENFKTSEWEAMFGGTSVKVPLAGGTYKEMNDHLEQAFMSGNKIDTVIRCLDMECLVYDKDAMMENYVFPTYMTNESLFDDVSYVFNKDVMKYTALVLVNTIKEIPMTSFDAYANWMEDTFYGAEHVLVTYNHEEEVEIERELTQEEITIIKENIRQNVTELIEAHPETTFYLFIPPYSICYWDEIEYKGELSYWLAAEKVLVEELLEYSNIQLYSFENNFALICDLDNYKDQIHYGEWVNSWMFHWIRKGDYMLTKDNYMDYFEEMEQFLKTYDYSEFR